MKNQVKTGIFTAAAALLVFAATPAAAEAEATVIEKTKVVTERTVPAPGAMMVNFMDYDLDGDGHLSQEEAGKMLFKLFDTDGNEIIDNVEYEKRTVATVVPMERETVVTIENSKPDVPNEVRHSVTRYFEVTDLTQYDKDGKGISPRDFTDRSFMEMDTNRDKSIDAKEWRTGYDAKFAAEQAIKPRINQ